MNVHDETEMQFGYYTTAIEMGLIKGRLDSILRFRCIVSCEQKEARRSTYSEAGFLKYQSIAPENTAKAAPPPSVPIGPEFLAKIAPETKPPATALVMSFFARY
jgi:hypothetical protein